MEPRQKRKASRFGEQVDRFFSNKHSASELILGLLEQISYKRPRKGPSPRKGPAKRLGRSAEEVPRPRKGWKEAQKPQKAQKPELEKAQKGRPRKGCEAQKKLGLGRGPEAHKRPRRGSRTLEEAQKPTKGLEEVTKAIVLSKFFRQACKPLF